MDMSWQTTFALACAAVFAAVVPGTLGYATARLETADQQRQELIRLRADLQAARAAVQRVSAPCKVEARGSGSGISSASGPSDDDAVPGRRARLLPPQAKPEQSDDLRSAEGVSSDPGLAPPDQE
jgi:hypothetical protein